MASDIWSAGSPILETIHPSWHGVFDSVHPQMQGVEKYLRHEESAGRPWLPAPGDIFRACELPMADVKVLVLGQDPYPTPGLAMGLAFSVASHNMSLPASLRNVYRELESDLGCPAPASGDLSPWANQGVLLLNRVLTVRARTPKSHRDQGWEAITDAVISGLMARSDPPAVAILWGREAQTVVPLLSGATIIASAHPSPLSAHRGFFGSRPFSRANLALESVGHTPIDWCLGVNGEIGS